jgi:hypothetical protein
MHARARKHYRVAKKELEPILADNGIYIPERQKTYAFGAAAFLMVLVLIQSIHLGYLLMSEHDA